MNCSAVQAFLGSTAHAQSLYGRALGRLLAHELYHVVGQTADHTGIGVTQAAVSARELLAARFELSAGALEKLRPPAER